MIPAKEAKEMLYTLLSQNLVQLQVCGSRIVEVFEKCAITSVGNACVLKHRMVTLRNQSQFELTSSLIIFTIFKYKHFQ